MYSVNLILPLLRGAFPEGTARPEPFFFFLYSVNDRYAGFGVTLLSHIKCEEYRYLTS